MRSLQRRGRFVVLNLHRVSPHPDPFWPPLHPELFRELLVFLKDKFEILPLEQVTERRTQKPVAVLSFDDGYYDFLEYAVPLLDKFDVQANMNIIPQCAETGEPIWNVRLYDFLNQAPLSLINEISLDGFDAKLESDQNEAKMAFGLKISRFLKNRARAERDTLLESIEPILSKRDFVLTRMMSADEIRSIADKAEIGVHSFTHESMGFEDMEFFRDDVLRCERYFEEKLELPLNVYAFPNGSHRPEQVEYLRSKGIKHILLVDEQAATHDSDVHPRLTIHGDSRAELRMRSVGF